MADPSADVIYSVERSNLAAEIEPQCGKKMKRRIWVIALVACTALMSGVSAPREAVADIINGVATQDLFEFATVGRRGSVDSGEFDYLDNDDRPTGSSGIVGVANLIEVGPVAPDENSPDSFPGTTTVGIASGRSETTFNSSNDIEVELSAFSSLTSIDPADGISGSYGANVQADSFFNFEVDEMTEAQIDASVSPNSNSSNWQIRLSGGPAGFVFNRLTNPGSEPLSFSSTVILFPDFNYSLRANVLAGVSADPGGANNSSSESINFRFRNLTAVPEPNSIAILGLVAMIGLAKRKRRFE